VATAAVGAAASVAATSREGARGAPGPRHSPGFNVLQQPHVGVGKETARAATGP
jgi:hypothetical protein